MGRPGREQELIARGVMFECTLLQYSFSRSSGEFYNKLYTKQNFPQYQPQRLAPTGNRKYLTKHDFAFCWSDIVGSSSQPWPSWASRVQRAKHLWVQKVPPPGLRASPAASPAGQGEWKNTWIEKMSPEAFSVHGFCKRTLIEHCIGFLLLL